jgi:uncharacterized protein YcfJ
MNTTLRIALAAGGFAFAAQAAAQVTFYENESFQGRSFTAQKRVDDFERFGFNDRATSAVVVGTRWEVCNDIRFGGDCTILRPGRYPSLASLGLNDRVSSARAVSANARIEDDRYAPMPAAAQAAQVTFYANEDFRGQSFSSNRQVPDFDRYGFNDRASSVEVIGERWEVCEDRGFRGNCVVLREGRYPSLRSMGLNDRISSVRVVRADEGIDEGRYAPAFAPEPAARQDYRRRNEERVYQANVTGVRAVVGAPGQRCWVEKEQAAQPQPAGYNMTGAVAGAVIGGILGHQVGSGKSKNVATAGGAVAGGLLGANIDRITGQPQAQAPAQDVQRCENVPSQTPTYWDVSYNFRGQDHRVQMTSEPGPTVTVNDQGEPRS